MTSHRPFMKRHRDFKNRVQNLEKKVKNRLQMRTRVQSTRFQSWSKQVLKMKNRLQMRTRVTTCFAFGRQNRLKIWPIFSKCVHVCKLSLQQKIRRQTFVVHLPCDSCNRNLHEMWRIAFYRPFMIRGLFDEIWRMCWKRKEFPCFLISSWCNGMDDKMAKSGSGAPRPESAPRGTKWTTFGGGIWRPSDPDNDNDAVIRVLVELKREHNCLGFS